MTSTFLTKEGFEKLQDELDYLRTAKRQEVADRLHEAMEGGELIENAEYEAAKNEQAFVEGRIQELERTSQEGFELSRQLKGSAEYKDIPILMLTAVKDKTGLDFKSTAGDESWLPVEAFLDKPVKPDVLLEKVASLLQAS